MFFTIENILVGLFLATPLAALVWCIISLIRFLKTPKEDPKRKPRRIHFIISAVVAGCLWAVIVSIIALFFLALTAM